MKKIIMLWIGLTAIFAQASSLSIRQDSLLYLAKMTSGIKMASMCMFANNIVQVEHRVIENLVNVFKNSFDEVYIQFIKDEKVPSGTADYFIFLEKINMAMTWLATPPTIPESIEMIRGGISFLDRLLKEQSIIDGYHVATGLQTLAEMEKLVGVNGQIIFLNEKQVRQLDQLVGQFTEFLITTIASFPSELTDNLQQTLSLAEKNIRHYSRSETEGITGIVEAYQGIESFIYMTLIGGNNFLLLANNPKEVDERLEQDLGRELLDSIIGSINISHEHLVMLLNYLAGDLPSHDFVQSYRQFLHKYENFFSTEQIQEAEQKLANLL